MSQLKITQKAGTPLDELTGSEHGDFTFDYTSSGHQRVTCKCGKAIVRQPYMTDGDWCQTLHEFEVNHRMNKEIV